MKLITFRILLMHKNTVYVCLKCNLRSECEIQIFLIYFTITVR
jgi:hypothetical protein